MEKTHQSKICLSIFPSIAIKLQYHNNFKLTCDICLYQKSCLCLVFDISFWMKNFSAFEDLRYLCNFLNVNQETIWY